MPASVPLVLPVLCSSISTEWKNTAFAARMPWQQSFESFGAALNVTITIEPYPPSLCFITSPFPLPLLFCVFKETEPIYVRGPHFTIPAPPDQIYIKRPQCTHKKREMFHSGMEPHTHTHTHEPTTLPADKPLAVSPPPFLLCAGESSHLS